MSRLRIVGLTALLAATLPVQAQPTDPPLKNRSLTELEQHRQAIEVELKHLAHYSLRSGVGAVGYRSRPHPEPTPEWIQIDLGEDIAIDQIVLVPAIWRDTETGFRAIGFPREFTIAVGPSHDTNGTVVAAFTERDRLLPRIAPLVVTCPSTTAAWVRVEASVLSARAWDGQYTLEFSEILVFSGQENVALGQPVRTSSSQWGEGNARKKRFLVDGFVPYLMDSAQGEQSIAFVSQLGIGDSPALTLDLGTSHALDRIHVHTTDLGDTIPHTTPPDFGIPHRLVVEGANQPDFSDAVSLAEFIKTSVFDVGPILIRRFESARCRYVRLTAIDPYMSSEPNESGTQIGFAEIEVFATDHNVALGKPVSANFEHVGLNRSLSALTDGRNLYGRLMPIRNWLGELARRHDLEWERPLVAAELNRRYARQQATLTKLGWLAALLVAGTILVVVSESFRRQRAIHRIRQRIAANVHDELGANLHAIGLLSDLAQSAREQPEKLDGLLKRMRALTERTGAAARYCTDFLEADGLYEELAQDMRRTSDRLMADLEHDLTVEGEDLVKQLRPRQRIDLFLFYKECLSNVLRHSGATRVHTRLVATPEHIALTVTDNGQGLATPEGNRVPASLKRRARLLGARVAAEPVEPEGTRITLDLKTRTWRLRK